MPMLQMYAEDPETGKEIKVGSVAEYTNLAYELIRKCVNENEKRGKSGDARFIVCAIHREKGLHTWFNLTCHEPKKNIACSSQRAAYAGHQGHAEMLLSGEWRLATAEEEKACKQKDEDAGRAKIAERESKAAQEQARTFNRMAQSIIGAVQAAPAQAPVVPAAPEVKQTPPPSAGVKTKEHDKK